ncbi:MAG: acyl-CoA dehydrogenase [Candidatus Brevundimonas phytovorans]|nr:acyl-CoA dehydrogenase [Brevundimonas sp.]WEK56767.1 MAG: acyl-CoA dehydrogenase [Brevundimonas sp.]
MNFIFSDEQRMFADAAETVLKDACEPLRLRRMLSDGAALDADRWAAIVETGLTQVLLPEASGGLGLKALDFLLIAEAAGRHLLPEPLVESAGVAVPLLAAVCPASPILVDPAVRVAIAHPLNPLVADADIADAILLHHEGATHLARPSQVTLTRRESIDPFRRLFAVEWTPVRGSQIAGDARLWEDALDRGALFAAAQGLGLAQRAIDLAVDYARDRQQFGKPIGSYQAVKHQLASAQVKIEFARPVLHAAAAGFDARDAFSRARISQAKLACLEAADHAARASLQVHGAMGYSYEVDVHLVLKRVLGLTFTWGDPAFHRTRVAARVFTRPTGPDQTFATEIA